MKEFVELREAWFRHVIAFDEDQTQGWSFDPAEANLEMKAKYDQQTVGIILGRQHAVAPTCAADMD